MAKVVNILDKIESAETELSNREVMQNLFNKLAENISETIDLMQDKDKVNVFMQIARLLLPAAQEDTRQLSKGASQDEKVRKLFKKLG